MNKQKIRIAMIAGEISGDLLGAHLIDALKVKYTEIDFYGIGGSLMQQSGLKSEEDMEHLSVRGYLEVIKSLPTLYKIRKNIIKKIIEFKPDVFIGIDAPSFNLPIENILKQHGIKTVHYVSPSVWAWKAKRVKKMVRYIDQILCLFPTEPELYEKEGGSAVFVGHPLAAEVPIKIDRTQIKNELGIAQNNPVFLIMPGSRKSEIQFMMPVFCETMKLLNKRYSGCQFLIPVATQKLATLIQSILGSHHGLNIQYFDDNKQKSMMAADVALVTSGTATLEVALCKTPMVISYRISKLTYFIVKRMIFSPFVGLPNILLNRSVVPELLQDDATAEKLTQAMIDWYDSLEKRETVKKIFEELHFMLQRDTSSLAVEAISLVVNNDIE